MYSVQFQIASLLILLILLLVMILKKSIYSHVDRLFIGIISLLCIGIGVDIYVSAMWLGTYAIPESYLDVCGKVHLSCLLIAIVLLVIYLYMNAQKDLEKVKRALPLFGVTLYFNLCYVWLQELILALSDRFQEFVPVLDNKFMWYDGSSATIAYLAMVLYLASAFLLVDIKNSQIRRDVRPWLKVLLVFLIIVVIQNCICMSWRMESLALALTAVYIYLNLLRRDSHIDKSLQIFNYKGFEFYMTELLEAKKEAYIIYIGFDDFKNLGATFGPYNTKKLFETIVASISKSGNGKFFRLNKYEIACVYVGNMQEYRNLLGAIKYKLREDYMILDAKIKVDAYVMEIPLHQMDFAVSDSHSMYAQIRYMMDKMYDENITNLVLGEKYVKEKEERNRIRKAIENAVRDQRVEIGYQPIYNVEKNCCDSVEAFLNLKDDQGNIIPVGSALVAAEDSGYVFDLEKLMFQQVFRFLNESKVLGKYIQKVHIHLSSVQNANTRLVEEVIQLMAQYHIAPAYIDLQLSEEEESKDNSMKESIDALIRVGNSFSLLNYGTGYSNLEQITELPFQYVILSESLLHSDKCDEKVKLALNFVLKMANQLGMKVIVKHISNQEDYEFFKQMHVDYIQGSLVSQILTEKEFVNYLEKALLTK